MYELELGVSGETMTVMNTPEANDAATHDAIIESFDASASAATRRRRFAGESI